MLISFEGIDGSGKSTQIKLLENALDTMGLKATVYREPGGTKLSEKIRELLLSNDFEINEVTEVLLFSSARSQLISEKVIPLLNNGEVVILDRFYDSTTAYQGYGRESMPIQQIDQINKIASHGLKPDITFYLRLTPEESYKRIIHKEKDRIERAGNNFFQKVFEGFEKLAKYDNRYKIIDANLSVEQIHKQIIEILLPHLQK